MRVAFATCLLLAAAGQAAAAPAPQDRYGPPRPLALASAQPSTYAGPTLRWAGKRDAAPVRAEAPAPAPALKLRETAPPLAPRRPEPQASLPQSLYDAPRRETQAPGRPVVAKPQAPVAPSAPALRASAPRPVAAPAQPQAVAAQTTQPAPRNHFYSLHREYGLTPDAIPPAPADDRYVLIGPGEAAPKDDKTTDSAGPF